MPKLLIKLTPLEPYFLGGERIFEKGDGNKHYFIRSLDTPAQSALFGVLRYLLIEKPGSAADFGKRYEQYRAKRENGEFKREFRGFALNRPEVAFENIKGISPLYIVDKSGCFFAPAPFDHISGNIHYKPFEFGCEVETVNGGRKFPLDYNAKKGIANGWMALDGKKRILTDLFEPVVQVGINRVTEEQGFFKKEYKRLKNGFSFAFFADISCPIYERIVYMGQGRSSFRTECEECEEPQFPTNCFAGNIAYAHSDVYFEGDIRALYRKCSFVAAKTRSHRMFRDSYLDRTDSSATQLIQAGSVFVTEMPEQFCDELKNEHAAIAGFNKILVGGKAL
jgi:CRISPR-associated protein Cmr3